MSTPHRWADQIGHVRTMTTRDGAITGSIVDGVPGSLGVEKPTFTIYFPLREVLTVEDLHYGGGWVPFPRQLARDLQEALAYADPEQVRVAATRAAAVDTSTPAPGAEQVRPLGEEVLAAHHNDSALDTPDLLQRLAEITGEAPTAGPAGCW